MKKAHKTIKAEYMDEEMNTIVLCLHLMKGLTITQAKRILSYVSHRKLGTPINWDGG